MMLRRFLFVLSLLFATGNVVFAEEAAKPEEPQKQEQQQNCEGDVCKKRIIQPEELAK